MRLPCRPSLALPLFSLTRTALPTVPTSRYSQLSTRGLNPHHNHGALTMAGRHKVKKPALILAPNFVQEPTAVVSLLYAAKPAFPGP